MTLLISCLLIHGLGLSPAWYIVASLLWATRASLILATRGNAK